MKNTIKTMTNKLRSIVHHPHSARQDNAFLDMQYCQQIVRQGAPVCFEGMPLKVHWKITDSCNYRCSYCFDYKKGYDKTFCTLEQAKSAIKHLASANRPSYQISLLGGEPTLHPYLSDIILLLRDSLGERIETINIVTNGSFDAQTIAAINEVAQTTRIELNISVHLEYANLEQLTSLVEKISNKVAITYLIMLHPAFLKKHSKYSTSYSKRGRCMYLT